ncbi:HNH endonuclease [Chondromyces apiculatus]|uniref:HNH endonuclease n=1 Tax=Chondromyces apiculatus TaxID=51 RepID=UPI001E344587|nr:HNH endonuclease [Chondromyces apiculatus]
MASKRDDQREDPLGEDEERTSLQRSEPLDLPVLVVNRQFHPVKLTSARRAFLLLYSGSALALDEAGELHDFSAWRRLPVREKDHRVPIVGGSLRVPRVVHLRHYDRVRRPTVPLTRKTVMLRDGHQCQYCSKQPAIRDLNIDHVIPRSRGGNSSWENLVTACRTCNLRKGWRTPDEASMRLIRAPQAPRWSLAALIVMGSPLIFEEWNPFLRAS